MNSQFLIFRACFVLSMRNIKMVVIFFNCVWNICWNKLTKLPYGNWFRYSPRPLLHFYSLIFSLNRKILTTSGLFIFSTRFAFLYFFQFHISLANFKMMNFFFYITQFWATTGSVNSARFPAHSLLYLTNRTKIYMSSKHSDNNTQPLQVCIRKYPQSGYAILVYFIFLVYLFTFLKTLNRLRVTMLRIFCQSLYPKGHLVPLIVV